jgi:hypothetical protein
MKKKIKTEGVTENAGERKSEADKGRDASEQFTALTNECMTKTRGDFGHGLEADEESEPGALRSDGRQDLTSATDQPNNQIANLKQQIAEYETDKSFTESGCGRWRSAGCGDPTYDLDALAKENAELREQLAAVKKPGALTPDQEKIVREKVRAGLTREQAIAVLQAQQEWDAGSWTLKQEGRSGSQGCCCGSEKAQRSKPLQNGSLKRKRNKTQIAKI